MGYTISIDVTAILTLQCEDHIIIDIMIPAMCIVIILAELQEDERPILISSSHQVHQ